MARKALLDKDADRGARFQEICRRLFPGNNRSEIARALGGVSPGAVRNWENGLGISRPILSRLEEAGVSLEYLLHGIGNPLADKKGKSSPKPKPAAAISSAEILAANLRHLRKQRFPGWGGQRRFAEFLGVSPNDLCVYEYGRALPNEQRLEDMAAQLNLAPDELLRLLPGVSASPIELRSSADLSIDAALEESRRGMEEDMRREMARLEAKVELLQDELATRDNRIRELEAANLALRSVMYLEDTPEAAERRSKLLERLEPTIAGLGGNQRIF